ncbi:ScbA/BarX family gamma-butyrolactone biosynthesis protein [Streptomyces sp. NPDC002537]
MLTTTQPVAPVHHTVATLPRLTTTVAREYVHRAALSEVFLSGWQRTGTDAFTVTAQWPRSHSFYSTGRNLYDPLLLSETVRQTFPLLMHAAYGVPFGHQLSWSHFDFSVNPRAMRVEINPAELELRVRCSDIVYRRSLPTSLSLTAEIIRDGSLLAVASTRFGCITPAVYRRLRAGHSDVTEVFTHAPEPVRPLAPRTVGRESTRDVVLAPPVRRGRWQLRVDTMHPILFDHAVDHVPGMLLMEAARQATHALEPSADLLFPLSMDSTFHHYVEFDSPCWIVAERLAPRAGVPDETFRVTALQNDETAFTADITTTRIS